MFNKMNNISFKKAFMYPNIKNLNLENRAKVDSSANMINELYPLHDVFIGANDEKTITFTVRKANPLVHILEPDVYKQTPYTIKEALAIVNLYAMMENSHANIYKQKIPTVQGTISNLQKFNTIDLINQFRSIIKIFDDKYPEIKH